MILTFAFIELSETVIFCNIHSFFKVQYSFVLMNLQK